MCGHADVVRCMSVSGEVPELLRHRVPLKDQCQSHHAAIVDPVTGENYHHAMVEEYWREVPQKVFSFLCFYCYCKSSNIKIPSLEPLAQVLHNSGMHTIFRDSPVPRYSQLADLLRQRIGRGVWAKGDKLPTLDELVREFNVARVTVRQAIALLARDGMLSAEQGRGTFVTGNPAQERWLRLETTLQDLADVYRDDKPKLTLLDEASATPALKADDGMPAPRYRYMRRVHSRNGVAYCVISIYLDERVFRLAPRRFRRETVVPVLLDLAKVKIARARQTLTISTADVEVAGHLGIAVNAPVAEVRRVFTTADSTVIYLGNVTYRGDYIHLKMDLQP